MIASDSLVRLGCEDRDACIKSAVTQHPELLQELSNILETLASQRADVGSRGDNDEAGNNQDDDESNQEDERAGRAQSGADLLQTFVFSATLTLPQKLRKRLRKGVHGGLGLHKVRGVSLCSSNCG